jgi:hypothetical protein
MSYLRLTTSDEPLDPLPGQVPVDLDRPGPGAVRFASFTPMNEQPGLADRKATFVIGAGGLLLSTVLFFIMPLSQFVRPGFWPVLILVLSFTLACVTFLGMRIAYRCYTLPVPVRPDNMLFFQNIAAVASDGAYGTKLQNVSERDALRSVLDYNYTMAKLGAAKYRLAGQSLLCLRIAIPIWMVLLIVISLRGPVA